MRVLVVPKWYPWADRPVFGIFCREQARALAVGHDVVPDRSGRGGGLERLAAQDRAALLRDLLSEPAVRLAHLLQLLG